MRPPYRLMFWSSGVGIGACLQEGLAGHATSVMWWASMFLLMMGFAWSPRKAEKEPPAEIDTFEQDIQQAMLENEAQRIKDATPKHKKWGAIAEQISARFYVAGVMGSIACHSPEGSRALRAVIMEMGNKLDKAVDKAWADAPAEHVIERARNLGGK